MGLLDRISQALGLSPGRADLTPAAAAPVDGRLADVRHHLERLQQDATGDAFLVIEIAGTEDFLQFITLGERLRLDFPLMTPRQREREAALRAVVARLGLEVASLSDADEFPVVDVDMPVAIAEAARVVEQLLVELYGVQAQTPLRFVLDS